MSPLPRCLFFRSELPVRSGGLEKRRQDAGYCQKSYLHTDPLSKVEVSATDRSRKETAAPLSGLGYLS
jgi:hypothetical protein